MRETFDIIKRVLKSKKLKEINEIIPESFYEKSSLVLITLLLFMFPHDVYVRYTHHRSSHMLEYFDMIGKIIFFYVIITLIIRASGLGKEGIKKYFKSHKQDLFFVIFMLLACVSTLQASDIKTAIYGAWYRDCGLISYFVFFSMYVLGRYVLKNTKTRVYIYFVFILVCSVQNLLVVAYYTGAKSKGLYGMKEFGLIEGAFYNINHSAYFMLMCILACMGLVMGTKSIVLKILGVVMYVFNLWALIKNNSFGPFLALVMAIVFLMVVHIIKNKKIPIELGVLVVIFVVVCGYMDYRTGTITGNIRVTKNDTRKIMKQDEGMERAGSGRMELWIDTVDKIQKKPLLGVGPDNLYTMQPHNEILQFAAEMGIPAACCYIMALVVIFMQSLNKMKQNDDTLMIEGSIVFGYIVSSMFGVVMYYTFGYYLFFLGMLCSYPAKENKL